MMFLKKFTSLAGLFSALVLIAGCSGSNDSKNNGVNGYPGYNAGIVTPLPNGGAQVSFTGQNVSANSSYIQGSTQDFNPGWPGTISLGGGQAQGGYSTVAFYGSSSCSYAMGSTVQVALSQTNFGVANVTGSISLSPSMVQVAFGSGSIPQLIGLYVDLKFAGSSISQGKVYFCTNKDAQGYCHGGVLGIRQGIDCQ